ncbi:MAG TPA: hypothetical protein P5572_20900 [Phycisphaerae bacterium]|nr:hypothetical protein [Phycisphaerales bacterium]HRX87492.1 hypothetical protein [Phycisphaerae bacterium]
MTVSPIPINIIAEDELSQAVAIRVLAGFRNRFVIGHTHVSRGAGYIRTRIAAFNQAARGMPWLVLTDLDLSECPAALIRTWFEGTVKNPNLLLRVAVREVEAWLLADRDNFSKFAGIRAGNLSKNVEAIEDPKRHLIQLARKSRSRAIREDLVPRPKSTARQGPNHNGRLIEFVVRHWSPRTAAAHAPSLAATLRCLENYTPQ